MISEITIKCCGHVNYINKCNVFIQQCKCSRCLSHSLSFICSLIQTYLGITGAGPTEVYCINYLGLPERERGQLKKKRNYSGEFDL